MIRTGAIALAFLLAITEFGAQIHKPPQKVVSPREQALKSLTGRALYACSPPSLLVKRLLTWPAFYLNAPDGTPTVYRMNPSFSFGTRLTIVGAQSDVSPDSDQDAKVKLDLLDQPNSRSATVELDVAMSDLKPARILEAVSTDYFSTHKIPGDPYVGMPEADLYCLEGDPDHVNSDAIGPDQLIYGDGWRYIYIGKNGRVEDIQESN